ncbi:Uma2 family endonuclease [Piscibacillus salipiscarius]
MVATIKTLYNKINLNKLGAVMRVTVEELQKNFITYLKLASTEDVIITRDDVEVARLSSHFEGIVHENLPLYGVGHKATYEEFLQLRHDSDRRYEYIDGDIYLLASPKVAHQYTVTQLLTMFSVYFDNGECLPFVAPFDIEVKRQSTEEKNMVQPDLMVICDLYQHVGEDDYYKGVPSLIVEVLSKRTQKKDLIFKLNLYMSCGVKEYWIVNPDNQEVMIYHFDNFNIKKYKTYKNDEKASSFIFTGLEIDLLKIFRTA